MYLIHKDIQSEIEIPDPIVRTGEVRYVLKDLNGKVLKDSGYIKNTFTNEGRRRALNQIDMMSVGSSGIPTTPEMTNLVSRIGGEFFNAIENVNEGPPNYGVYTVLKQTYTGTDLGTGTGGTIAEIGLYDQRLGSNGSAALETLMCRGVVPPVVVGTNNVIDVYYKVYRYPDLTESSGTVLIDGINYAWRSRFRNIVNGAPSAYQGLYLYRNDAGWPNADGDSGSRTRPSSLTARWSPAELPTFAESPNCDLYEPDQINGTSGATDSIYSQSGLKDGRRSAVQYYRENEGVNYDAREFTYSVFFGLESGNEGARATYAGFAWEANAGIRCVLAIISPSAIYRHVVEYKALDGPRIGDGLLKNNTEYLTVSHKYSWDVNLF